MQPSSKVLGPLLVRFTFDLCGCFQLFHAYFFGIDPCEIKHHIAVVRMPEVLPTPTSHSAGKLCFFFSPFWIIKHEIIMVVRMLWRAGCKARVHLLHSATVARLLSPLLSLNEV